MSDEVISDEPGATGSGSPGAEDLRLRETRTGTPWRAWGPYLSERQWGTVREDYSDGGRTPESYFTHDQARSRAYRWGEDGIAGISDDSSSGCAWRWRCGMSLGPDPQGAAVQHRLATPRATTAEDVKEYYFYVDNVPTHSYHSATCTSWYPQAEFPYNGLGRGQPGNGRARSSSTS